MRLEGFVGPSSVVQSNIVDNEETVNLYLERSESSGATVEWALYPIPGSTVLSSAASGIGRAHEYLDGREFAIIGTDFIEIDLNGAQTSRGTVANDGLPGTISSNGDGGGQLLITSGGLAYSFILSTNTFAAITDLNGYGAVTMAFISDGFGVALVAATSTIYISALNNVLNGQWDATQFIQRSQSPDPWVAIGVSNKYLYFFGQKTSEVWYNAGTSPIPFQPTSSVLNYGCAAAWSVAVFGDEIGWLTSTANGQGAIVAAAGLSIREISTFAVEKALAAQAQISDGIGDCYTDRGHTFYILTFPFDNVTWTWDQTTDKWAKRGTWVSLTGTYNLWRPMFIAFAFGALRALDVDGSSVYTLSGTVFTDVDGSGMRILRRSPTYISENKRIFYSTLEIDIQAGVGTSGGGSPLLMLRLSNDGGNTWGNERTASIGAIGEYSERVRFTRCGSGRRRVFEISGTFAVPYRILGAWLTE